MHHRSLCRIPVIAGASAGWPDGLEHCPGSCPASPLQIRLKDTIGQLFVKLRYFSKASSAVSTSEALVFFAHVSRPRQLAGLVGLMWREHVRLADHLRVPVLPSTGPSHPANRNSNMTIAGTTAAAIGAGVVAVVGIIWPLASWRSVATLDKPRYVLVKVLGDKKR